MNAQTVLELSHVTKEVLDRLRHFHTENCFPTSVEEFDKILKSYNSSGLIKAHDMRLRFFFNNCK